MPFGIARTTFARQGLMLIVACLLTFGVLMVGSAGQTIDTGNSLGLLGLLGRPALLGALALVMMVLGSRLPVRWLARGPGGTTAFVMIGVGIIALLVAVYLPVIGREVNGARRWISLGPVGFQPSEVAKWGLLPILAGCAARHAGQMGGVRWGLVYPLLLVGLICALVGAQDLGTAALIGFVSVGVLLAGGARLVHLALVAPVAVAGFAAAVVASPYRLQRLRAFLDPYQDPQGIGYHLIHSLATVTSGGIPGRGLGNGIQKFGYLPEDTTDFIFAIICEELGLIGAATVIFLYCGLLVCGWLIVRSLRDPFSRLLAVGILLTVGLQALFNIAVVTGVAPTKGIALPLVSSGGTGWVLTAFSIGLLVSMSCEAQHDEPSLVTKICRARCAGRVMGVR